MEQQTVKGNTMTTVINPAKTISLTKCRPNTTRKEPTAVPKMTNTRKKVPIASSRNA